MAFQRKRSKEKKKKKQDQWDCRVGVKARQERQAGDRTYNYNPGLGDRRLFKLQRKSLEGRF